MRPTPPVLDVLWMFYDGRFAAVATTMQIWVDADACPGPIKEILFRAADKRGVQLTLVANHPMRVQKSAFIRLLQVEQGFDKADAFIADRVEAGDLVITADIPLAADVVEAGGAANLTVLDALRDVDHDFFVLARFLDSPPIAFLSFSPPKRADRLARKIVGQFAAIDIARGIEVVETGVEGRVVEPVGGNQHDS